MKLIEYKLINEQPIKIRNYAVGNSNQIATVKYIAGSSIRGYIVSKIANEDKEFFEKYKRDILINSVRFSNAYIAINNEATLPSPKLFYATKDEPNRLLSGFGERNPKAKRAKVGSFCTIEGSKLSYSNVELEEAVGNCVNYGENEIKNENGEVQKKLFRSQAMTAGQLFCGYIQIDNDEIAEKIQKIINRDSLYIGSSISSGYGRCKIVESKVTEGKAYTFESMEVKKGENNGSLTMYLLSDTCMVNEIGEPCGMDLKYLEEKLGVSDLKIEKCATSTTEIFGVNRTWQSNTPSVTMYEKGSIFQLSFNGSLDYEALNSLQSCGIGLRRYEGYGQILFTNALDTVTISEQGIESSTAEYLKDNKIDEKAMAIGLAKNGYRRLIERGTDTYIVGNYNTNKLRGLSSSQRGTILSMVLMLKYSVNRAESVFTDFFKNNEKKTESTASNFRTARAFIQKEIFQKRLSVILNTVPLKFMGYSIEELFDSNEIMYFKLNIIERYIRYQNRKEEKK